MKKDGKDHRTRVTQLLIRKAFTELLKTKPIQSISIKELCEEAGINRGTFYTHYSDIYQLLHKIEDEMLVDFEKSLEPMLSAENKQLNPVELSTEIFQCLKDNSDVCIMTLGDYGDKEFALKLINIGREKCVETYSRYFKNTTPQQIEYFYAFASAGCMGLLQKWVADGMSCSAAEMAQMAESLMIHGVGFFKI